MTPHELEHRIDQIIYHCKEGDFKIAEAFKKKLIAEWEHSLITAMLKALTEK